MLNMNFIDRCDIKIGLKDKKILEIGCGNGDDLKYLREKYKPSKITGIDVSLDKWCSTKPSKGDGWEIKYGNAEELEFEDASFDGVVSIATFEHIGDLAKTLKEIKRVLKPAGKFYTEYSPIWTSIIGHHYKFWIDASTARIIPPWGHLWMEKDEMYDHVDSTFGEEEAKKVCEYVFDNQSINRLPKKEHLRFLLNSGFWVRELNEHIAFNRATFFGDRANELSDDICSRLFPHYEYSDLAVMGFTVLLEKYIRDPR